MDQPMSATHFRFMALGFWFRDLFQSPGRKVEEVGVKPGDRVLDFGCGPGSYTIAAAERVGESGKVYALDIHPLAIEGVQRFAARRGLRNVETIQSEGSTGLEDGSIDVVLLFDTLHDLGEPDAVLQELHRVLKADGRLSFSDHHMKEDEIVARLTAGGLFRLSRKGKRTHLFTRA